MTGKSKPITGGMGQTYLPTNIRITGKKEIVVKSIKR